MVAVTCVTTRICNSTIGFIATTKKMIHNAMDNRRRMIQLKETRRKTLQHQMNVPIDELSDLCPVKEEGVKND